MDKYLIIEISLKLSIKDLLNFSLCCKKYFNWIWGNETFWRNKVLREFGICDIKDNEINYRLLRKIKYDPQYYYSSSICEKNTKLLQLIPRVFNIHYPLIGVVKENDDDYFGIIYNEKLNTIINYAPNIYDLGEIALSIYSKYSGISYSINESPEIFISRLKTKLYSLNLVFNKGDRFIIPQV